MRLRQGLRIALVGVTASDIGHEERVLIADAIFRSSKYVDGAIDSRIGQSYLESVDVDGEKDIFTQYLDEMPVAKHQFGEFDPGEGEDTPEGSTNNTTPTEAPTAVANNVSSVWPLP